MQPWTREELLRFAPAPRPRHDQDDRPADHAAYIATLLDSWPLLQEYGINNPLRVAHFMAIIGHETGGLQIVREDCRWTYDRMCQLWPDRFQATNVTMRARYMACRGDEEQIAELAYGGWASLGQRLGNTEKGDGYLYRGGGPFQDTGRARYREAGAAIGVDLEGSPEQIEDPRIAVRVTLYVWRENGLNEMADRNYLRAIQNSINRGNPFSQKDPNGWESRQRWFDRAWAVWGRDAVLPSPLDLSVGAQGAEVKAFQENLRRLGYACGSPDGVFGPECRRAVAAFKADHKAANPEIPLEPDDVVGPATRAALATAEPIRRPEREKMTVQTLLASGSTEAMAGRQGQLAGQMMAGLGVLGATAQADLPKSVDPTPVLRETIGWIPSAKSTIIPAIDGIQWAVSHFWWVAAFALGIWWFAKGRQIINSRLLAARKGWNLWR